MNPIQRFQTWFKQECDATEARVPAACCLSTIGLDGYPNARFVALKEVRDGQFIITGPLSSRKGQEIAKYPKAALTFWWPATGRQVRVQGDAVQIDASDADRFFSKRPREAQIVSWISKQGLPLKDVTELHEQYAHFTKSAEREISRPENWGGFSINPIRIEFLSFSSERFHERLLYSNEGVEWKMQKLQP